MNEKAQRRDIAKAMGWEIAHHGNLCWDPDGNIPCIWSNPFDPLKDLNACYVSEKVLTDEQWLQYRSELFMLMPKSFALADCERSNIHAPAAQRCEAWLKTKGLWKEDAP